MEDDSNNSLESEPKDSNQPDTNNQTQNSSPAPKEDSSNQKDNLENSLEQPNNTVADQNQPEQKPGPTKGSPKTRLISFLSHINVYLVLFGVLILVGFLVALLAYTDSKKSSTTANINSKDLSASTLAQLANSDTSSTVGGNGQLLNVESSAVFSGQVLVRQGLDVAGNLSIGGALALNDLTVSGTTQLQQTTVNKNLSVAGDTNLQGSTVVAKNLQVGGTGNFSGTVSAPQITTTSLQLNGPLALSQHITTTGAQPSHTNGSALGGGGTTNLSGSDTAGLININTGDSPGAGCFITLNFSSPYASAPYVMLTPVGSSAGGLSYYINRTASGFSLCDASTPPANASFGFDYFIVG
jgi:cytoskeletal protein CcmA (bactofilin family)